MYALHCSQPLGAKLHVFGFNWNNRHSDMHSIKDEEREFREAAKRNFVVLHPTGEQKLCHPRCVMTYACNDM